MQRRVFLLLGLMLAAPAFAQASVISILPGQEILQPGLAGQTITLLISGTDLYTDSNMSLIINGGVGPAPAVQTVMGDTGGSIPIGNLATSVWVGGNGGINLPPEGTTLDSTGLTVGASFTTPGFAPISTGGTYAVLTVSTVGVGAGAYSFDLGATTLLLSDPETGDAEFVTLSFGPTTVTVVPEPSSIVMGLFAAAGMAAVVIRRRRAA